jgi:hypothetical protein
MRPVFPAGQAVSSRRYTVLVQGQRPLVVNIASTVAAAISGGEVHQLTTVSASAAAGNGGPMAAVDAAAYNDDEIMGIDRGVSAWSSTDTARPDTLLGTAELDLRGGIDEVVGFLHLWSRAQPCSHSASGCNYIRHAHRASTQALMDLACANRWQNAQLRAGFRFHLWSTNPRTSLLPACVWCWLETGCWCPRCENGRVRAGVFTCRTCAGARQDAHPRGFGSLR